MLKPALSFTLAAATDFEALHELRVQAMRDSLQRLGRFDLARSRARFCESFEPACTRHVWLAATRVGFFALRPNTDGLLLDHLYIHPDQQGQGIGSAILSLVFAEADAAGLELRVGALRGSDANRFYVRHGFAFENETEWDVHYVRRPIPLGCDS